MNVCDQDEVYSSCFTCIQAVGISCMPTYQNVTHFWSLQSFKVGSTGCNAAPAASLPAHKTCTELILKDALDPVVHCILNFLSVLEPLTSEMSLDPREGEKIAWGEVGAVWRGIQIGDAFSQFESVGLI